MLDDAHVTNEIKTEAAQTRSRNFYHLWQHAFDVPNDDMAPRYRKGETIYCSDEPIVAGCEGIIELKSGTIYAKEILEIKRTVMTVRDIRYEYDKTRERWIQPAKSHSIKLSQCRKIYRISGAGQ